MAITNIAKKKKRRAQRIRLKKRKETKKSEFYFPRIRDASIHVLD